MRHSLITPRISSAEEKTKLIVDKTTTIRQSLRWNDMMYMTKRQNNNKSTKSQVERQGVDEHRKTKHKVFSALCILTKNYSGFVICGGEGRGALTNAAKLSSSKDKDISSSKDNGKHRAM